MNEPQEVLQQWLQQIATLQRSNTKASQFAYAGLEDLLLQLGQPYQPAPRPKGIRKGRIKMCFMNSYRLSDSGLFYCEGLAMANKVPIPVHHAWCIDQDERVVDPTWNHGTAYFGVCFTHEYVHERARKTGCYGILGDWAFKDFMELLREGIPEDALVKPVQATIPSC